MPECKFNGQYINELSKNTIVDLFVNANIDYRDKIFYADHYLTFDDFKNFVPVIGPTQKFVWFAEKALGHLSTYTLPLDNVSKKFSYMSNKDRRHRILSSMIIANLFSLDDIFHTKVNHNACSDYISKELLAGTSYDFDTTKSLPLRALPLLDVRMDFSELVRYTVTNPEMRLATTSVVTEPCFFEKGCMLTEKTLNPIYLGHFIIWPGSWGIADAAKRIGLDVFDDYIDHSYQYLEHPGERVVEAFLRNKGFLDNIELQQEAKNKCRTRMQSNLDLVRDIPRLASAIGSLSTYVPV